MVRVSRHLWIYGLITLFVVLNSYYLSLGYLITSYVPLILIALLFLIFSFDKLVLFVALTTPLSLNFYFEEFGAGFNFPTEPLMAGLVFVFFLQLCLNRSVDLRIYKHPVTLAITINMVWIFITSVSSSMPLISFKFLTARLWFIVVFYFIAAELFKDIRNIRKFIWLFVIGLTITILYTLYKHAQMNFSRHGGYTVMQPFFSDHTSYAAVMAMFFFMLFIFAFSKHHYPNRKVVKMTAAVIFAIFIIGILFSYTRAAWISLAAAICFYFLLKIRVRFSLIAWTTVISLSAFVLFQNDIYNELRDNTQDSSADYKEHLQSISNVSTDASNVERLNRWKCAIRMFKEKPILGWGPGTYMFQYSSFQRAHEMTIISTTIGDAGNAHSEYLGPLSESGILGMLTFIFVLGLIIRTGMRVYYTAELPEIKLLALGILLGCITYIIHGILNNFLDQDKAAVPFWAFAAILVTLDFYHNNRSGTMDAQ